MSDFQKERWWGHPTWSECLVIAASVAAYSGFVAGMIIGRHSLDGRFWIQIANALNLTAGVSAFLIFKGRHSDCSALTMFVPYLSILFWVVGFVIMFLFGR